MKKTIKRESDEQVGNWLNDKTISKITNEQIIQSARRQRQSVDSRISVEPWHSHHSKSRGLVAAIAIAACFVGFIAGYGLRANVFQSDIQNIAQNIQVMHDTILQTATIRDTFYQTRIVTKYAEPLTAQTKPKSSVPSSPDNPPVEQMACSMLCDDIPYDLLAAP